MQQAIRALGWATKIFWIILIVLVVTIAYSASLINIALGEPQTITTEQTVTISFPITICNNGFYDVVDLNVTTFITDQNNRTLAKGTTVTRLIPRGAEETHTHRITINITQVLAENTVLLFNDTMLTMFQQVSLNYARVVLFMVQANQTLSWGAPLSNFALEHVAFRPYNLTHSYADVQFSFENHNQFLPVTGVVRVEILNAHQTLLGQGTADVDAPSNTFFNGELSILVNNSISATPEPSGEVRFYFETPLFNYGPLVMVYG
ncbi:MAG: hypothetical protein ACQXXH_01490 [Candidatus Bathyarchaeia archaeon]|jgi:hypothetical protein|nr:hypothetical protein [Candidatus Bathyarchaeota archaeon A05DMB-4]MDH7596092.1 hypothetical protein [Candidatus Bathyarchaeota archaeon]